MDLTAPVTPNYNLSSPDKAQHVRQNPALTQRAKCWENQHFRDRWRALLSVDDVIRAVYDKLAAEDALKDTFILYTISNLCCFFVFSGPDNHAKSVILVPKTVFKNFETEF